jgi:hypothetical protein
MARGEPHYGLAAELHRLHWYLNDALREFHIFGPAKGVIMKRLVPRLMLVAAFSASAALAEAQAVHRGGESSTSSSGSSSSGSSSGSSGGGSSTSSSSGGGSTYSAPPQHSAPPRTPSHSGGSNSGSASRSGSSSSGSGSSAGTAAVRHPNGSSTTTATAPTYSRPDGRPGVGYAVPRTRQQGPYRPPTYIYSPYYVYNPWGYGAFGYGYGLSYLYDPFYGGGFGWPGGYGYGGYGYGGYGGGYGYPGGYGYYDGGGYTSGEQSEAAQDLEDGQLRIKVKPREARVMVDGAFVGTVDDFDGVFQKLSLPEGRHQVVLQLDGYQPLSFEVMIIAGQTINYQGEMHKR